MTEQSHQTKMMDYLILAIGIILYTFVSWHYNTPLAAWIAPIFLMRFFRNQTRFLPTLIAFPLLVISTSIKTINGWDMELYLFISFTLLVPITLVLIPLYLDRYFVKKLPSSVASLVFPCSLLLMEYIFNLTSLGTAFSLGATQFDFGAMVQLVSITGIWGLSFLIAWTASVVNTLWNQDFDLKNPSQLVKIYGVVFIIILSFGSFRLALFEPNSDTVRVASITITHPQDYWTEIIDKETPSEEACLFHDEFMQMEDKLFNLSLKAVNGGAQIIFWSEANSVYYEDQEETFLNRAKIFAQDHQIYFAPAVLKLYYGSYISDNMVYMITPEGDIAFDYVKTISWYESTSDGVIDYVDTPYGRISVAICFENDFPNFIRQAGKNDVDILLVPSYDTETIKNYHTKQSLIRGIENGMSVIRQSNKGTSMGINYHGEILSFQDYFDTEERLMYTDLPTKGVQTFYAIFGDWVIYTNLVVSVGFLATFLSKKVIQRRKTRNTLT